LYSGELQLILKQLHKVPLRIRLKPLQQLEQTPSSVNELQFKDSREEQVGTMHDQKGFEFTVTHIRDN